MDIYHHVSLVANSTSYGAAPPQTKGVMVVNTAAGATQATLYPYGATTGTTFAARIDVAANSTTILPVKIGGASAASSSVFVYSLF